MLRATHSSLFTATNAVCFLACLLLSSPAAARQWPVHGGPVDQAVPQYRSSGSAQLPMQSTSPTQPNQYDPVVQMGEPDAERLRTRISQPIAQSNPKHPEAIEPVKAEPLPTPQSQKATPTAPAATHPPRATVRYPLRAAVSPSRSKTAAKTTAKKAAKTDAKKRPPSSPVVRYDIYRDRNPLPIDPRKPVNPCTHPSRASGCCSCDDCGGCGGCGDRVCKGCNAPGLHGKPYQETESGGYDCTKKKCGKNKPMFNQYWPRPFSAKLDEHFAQRASDRYQCPEKKRCVDIFDRFIDFKLVDYHRKDNGYCGEDSDPYGCLGESRMIASGVMGVGYRFPSVPVERSASKESFWY